MSEPVVPRHGAGALSDVAGAVAAHLGVPDAVDVLGLPDAERYVVVLVDGLGWQHLLDHGADLPYLGELAQRGRPLTSGAPSTTAASITSLGTGLAPGQHGIAGYRFWLPATAQLVSPLLWDTPAEPVAVQSHPTWFERITAAGDRAAVVAPARFEGSGLTGCALRGADFHGLAAEDDAAARIETIVAAAGRGPGLTYAYDRHLDHTGHSRGIASWQWLDALGAIDEQLADLRQALPDDVVLLITGDHGMIDVPAEDRIVVEDDGALMAGLDHIGGEGRFRHLYTTDPAGVAARWSAALGERAWVRTREQAAEQGWFGPLDPVLAPRFGDVVVAMRATSALMTRTMPKEMGLVGMHGSLTPAEMLVPLLLD